MVKVPLTLDDQTVERLRRLAARPGRPQSHVVRESIKESLNAGDLEDIAGLRLYVPPAA